MIVPSMSYEEKREELIHDFHIAAAKAPHIYKQLRFEMHKRRQTHATQTLTWKSPLHNTWMSFYKMEGRNTNVIHVCITMDHRNLLKVLSLLGKGKLNDLYIGEFNIHFYKRYNERLKLNLPNPMLIVKHYYKHNFVNEVMTGLSKTDDQQIQKVFAPVKGGVVLGYRYDDKKWFDIKTFVSDEMLRASQLNKVEYLKGYKLEK